MSENPRGDFFDSHCSLWLAFVCWCDQELDQIKHIGAQKEEELMQRHLLERKRLPKILKSDTKTRTMMYRESLRITGGEFSLEEERERMKQVDANSLSFLSLSKWHLIGFYLVCSAQGSNGVPQWRPQTMTMTATTMTATNMFSEYSMTVNFSSIWWFLKVRHWFSCFHCCRRQCLWPSWFVAVMVCGRHGLWPAWFVAGMVCGRHGLWPAWYRLGSNHGTVSTSLKGVIKNIENMQSWWNIKKRSATTATFVAVVDPGMRISFLFSRCRYLSVVRYLRVDIDERHFNSRHWRPTMSAHISRPIGVMNTKWLALSADFDCRQWRLLKS